MGQARAWLCHHASAHASDPERITPPKLHFEILTPRPIPMEAGTVIGYRLRLLECLALAGAPRTLATLSHSWTNSCASPIAYGSIPIPRTADRRFVRARGEPGVAKANVARVVRVVEAQRHGKVSDVCFLKTVVVTFARPSCKMVS